MPRNLFHVYNNYNGLLTDLLDSKSRSRSSSSTVFHFHGIKTRMRMYLTHVKIGRIIMFFMAAVVFSGCILGLLMPFQGVFNNFLKLSLTPKRDLISKYDAANVDFELDRPNIEGLKLKLGEEDERSLNSQIQSDGGKLHATSVSLRYKQRFVVNKGK